MTAPDKRAMVTDRDGKPIDYFERFPVTADLKQGFGDAFGRLRVAAPETLFDSKQLHDSQPLFWDDAEVSGSGTTSAWQAANASTSIGVGASTAGKRVRQTFQRFNYQPGKSQHVLMTGVLKPDASGAGIVRSFGYFDDNNGLFVRDNEGTVQVVRRSAASGSPVDLAVDQADWNIDPMDGSGPSELTMDFSKVQIFSIAFEWLGVGSAFLGFYINGVFWPVHTFDHANLITTVYMSSPNLPLRYEIENDGTGAASSLRHICTSVISEGGSEDLGIARHVRTGSVGSVTTGNVYALVGIRLKAATLDSVVNILKATILMTSSNDQGYWSLRLNPTIGGTFAFADQTNSVVQTATGAPANTVSGGTIVDGGFVLDNAPVLEAIKTVRRLGASIAGVADRLVLCYEPLTANQSVYAGLTWQELS